MNGEIISVGLQEDYVELAYVDSFDHTPDVMGSRLLRISNRLVADQLEELNDVLGDILQAAQENLRTGGSDTPPTRDGGGAATRSLVD